MIRRGPERTSGDPARRVKMNELVISGAPPNLKNKFMTVNRPIGVTLIAFLAILGAVNAFVVTLQYLHILPVYVGQVAFYTFSLFGAFFWALITFFFIWLFQMLWTMQPQGWLFAVIFSSFTLLFDLIAIIGGTSWEALIAGIIVSAIILIYCLLPGTKQSFGIPE
jgi:hypothetical protein